MLNCAYVATKRFIYVVNFSLVETLGLCSLNVERDFVGEWIVILNDQ